MSNETQQKANMDGIQFFGSVDRTRDGKIKSAMPAYYNPRHVEELKEEIHQMEVAISNGYVSQGQVGDHKAKLKQKKERLDEIESSKPKLTAKQKDTLKNIHGELGEQIRDSMFTYSDMHRGTADAHKELERMKEPCIKVNPEVAEACGVRVNRNGEVSRDGATKIYQIVGRNLGENTMVERLRRDIVDGYTGTKR